jgi:serine protease Do
MALLMGIVDVASARSFAWLGVRIRDLSEQEMEEISSRHGIREGFGVYIVDVLERAPAQEAGIKRGDVVVAVDGRPIVESRALQRALAAVPPGRDVTVTVLRPEGRRPITTRLAAMPKPIVGERVAGELGFVIRDNSGGGEIGRSADAAPAVAVVVRGGPAERAGLTVGDVILQINERAVITGEAAREALAETEPSRALELTVRRGAEQRSITITAQ